MSKRSNYNCLEVGDVVRVVRSNGTLSDTRYKITTKKNRMPFVVGISEIGHDGKLYATQAFDVDLLRLEPKNDGVPMLAALFSK
jgi:hypothetical protein